MAVEIERKFLLKDDSWRSQASAPVRYRQGYLTGTDKSSVRVRIQGEQAFLNIKSATLGIQRQEYEYAIPLQDAEKILDELCNKPLIEKDRYFVEHGHHTWEIDEFHGDNQGLIVAEVELLSEDEKIDKPSWVGQDVSHDTRYYNVCLVTHPYKDW
ncbi:MAG: CYTH domain-containing protein [Thioalkalispiraceae bacterium]|jgi:adenylate cyclase